MHPPRTFVFSTLRVKYLVYTTCPPFQTSTVSHTPFVVVNVKVNPQVIIFLWVTPYLVWWGYFPLFLAPLKFILWVTRPFLAQFDMYFTYCGCDVRLDQFIYFCPRGSYVVPIFPGEKLRQLFTIIFPTWDSHCGNISGLSTVSRSTFPVGGEFRGGLGLAEPPPRL